MFKFFDFYTNLIHVSKVQGNPAKSKITYFFDGRIETQTFADSSEYDEVMAALEDKFISIGGVLYNPGRISIVKVNGLTAAFHFVGGKIITETYAGQADIDAVIQKVDATHIEVEPNKWISGKQLHIASVNEAALEIKYEYLGREVFAVAYEDQSAYEDAVEKLEALGECGGAGEKLYSYSGVYNATESDDAMPNPITAEFIKGLVPDYATKRLCVRKALNDTAIHGDNDEGYTRYVYAYPKEFGTLSTYQLEGSFEVAIGDSFTRDEVEIDDVPYWVYYLTDSTDTDNKGIIYK